LSTVTNPRLVGRYAIYGEIASGGMASVHYGRLIGPAGFSRTVAIKRLHAQFAKDPDFVGMFLDEARLASRIRHPNVVSILEVVAEEGELFLVMDFVQGEALSRLVRTVRGGMPIPIAVSIVVGVLEGLHAAHEARGELDMPLSIVHRDVSPQNILVGVNGVAHLIDFGVAKAVGNSRMTRDGHIKGKIAYMAPEQIVSAPIDRRADVYSAGVILWEALTGTRLFSTAETEVSLLHQALYGTVEPPSIHRRDVSPELDAIVLRGLAREPDQRFATARDMAQALEQAVASAAPRDVGLWVQATAGASLRNRAARVAEIEASSHVAPVDQGARDRPGGSEEVLADEGSTTLVARKAPEAESLRNEPLPARDLSSVSVSRGAIGRSGRPKTWSFAVIGGVIVSALMVGFYAARIVGPRSGSTVPDAVSTRGAIAPSPDASNAPQVQSAAHLESSASAEPPQAPSAPSATQRAAASADGAGPASRPVRAPAQKRPAPRTPAASPPPDNCSPPYTVTADGVRQFKRHCLK
jgi:eukaryotic-like serine/threonine-protein kinase